MLLPETQNVQSPKHRDSGSGPGMTSKNGFKLFNLSSDVFITHEYALSGSGMTFWGVNLFSGIDLILNKIIIPKRRHPELDSGSNQGVDITYKPESITTKHVTPGSVKRSMPQTSGFRVGARNDVVLNVEAVLET